MEFVKLKRGDVIKIHKGMIVWATIPKKFIYTSSILEPECNEPGETSLEIGKVFKFPHKHTDSLEVFKKNLENVINSVLSDYGASPENYKDEVDKFIDSLNLSISEDTFDTSIFEGEYKIYHTDSYDGFNWIFCEKRDGSGLELKFDYQKDPNKIKFELLSTKK